MAWLRSGDTSYTDHRVLDLQDHNDWGMGLAAFASLPFPHVRPDLDKLERAVLDCLGKKGAGVINDDGQVVDLTGRKRYGPDPHLLITVTSLDLETTHPTEET